MRTKRRMDMYKELFNGLFDTEYTNTIEMADFLLCLGAALIAGLIIAGTYIVKTRYSKSFIATLAILPVVVCVVIMVVNGNVGIGVAVAGAFSLVRFRSAPGTAKEICAIFMTMGAGLLAGMGYLGYSILFAAIVGVLGMIFSMFDFGEKKNSNKYKQLRITIPEDLNYTDVFDDILLKYTSDYELTNVKTTNMGSMFRLTYNVVMKHPEEEKALIDDLRVKNGNLEISISRQESLVTEL